MRLEKMNEFMGMNGHTIASPGLGAADSTLETATSGANSFYSSETMYSDERSPLLTCTPTPDLTKQSSVFPYVGKSTSPKGTR